MIETTETRKCDVYGTKRDVKRVAVSIDVLGEDDSDREWFVDLGSRALGRLADFINRGVHPAGWKPEAEEGESEPMDEAKPAADRAPQEKVTCV